MARHISETQVSHWLDDTATRDVTRDDRRRGELLEYVGPMLAATPEFYTFLDEDGTSCQFRAAETLQVEYQFYSDGACQQALMDGNMAITTSMRYVQKAVVVVAQAE